MIDLASRLLHGLERRQARARNNRRIEGLARQVALHSPPSSAAPVIFFNASTRLSGVSLNAAFSLLSSWALRLAGVPVAHFVCRRGMSPCVLGSSREEVYTPPPCAGCIAQSQALYGPAQPRWFQYQAEPALERALAGLRLAALSDFCYHGLPLGSLALPSLRWILRRHDLQDDEPTRYLYRQYILSAYNVAQEFSALLDETNPQAVVVFNGMFYPEATARRIAQGRGLRVISHEVGLRPFTAFFTEGEATAYPIDIPADFELTPTQEERLNAYLEQRFQGNFSMAGIRFWPQMRSLSDEFLQRAAAFRQIVPVFSNVIFDTSQGHANTVFTDMFAWLDLTLEVIRAHPETLFVLRAHPDEGRPGKESRQSVADWVRRRQAGALPNLVFVDAGQPFSSYELIRRSKFVMVYNSTIGLEASLLRAAVLCGGKARFTQLPTVYFPSTPQEYRQTAEEFLAAGEVVAPAEFQRNARRFLYYQLYRASLPFDEFLQDDGYWPGYAALKPFEWQALQPEQSLTLRVVVEGILRRRPFLLDV